MKNLTVNILKLEDLKVGFIRRNESLIFTRVNSDRKKLISNVKTDYPDIQYKEFTKDSELLKSYRQEKTGLIAPDMETDFEHLVLQTTSEIPFGETLSYGELASEINHPGASRAVGNALRKNPFPVLIPCHRVIRSNGKAGGYGGKRKSSVKLKLLTYEGVEL